MTSIVEICNLALASIRSSSINSLTEGSLQAQQCKLHYDIARQFVLTDTPWNFAKKTAALQLRDIEPLEWTYAYQYPSDCARLLNVHADFGYNAPDTVNRALYDDVLVEPETNVPYEVMNGPDGKLVVTDQVDAYAIYTKNVTNPTMFDAQFTVALYQYLASMIAVPIMGGDIGRAMREDNLQLYRLTMSSTVSNMMNESKRKPRKDAALVTARR
jgi:hypothetical protein